MSFITPLPPDFSGFYLALEALANSREMSARMMQQGTDSGRCRNDRATAYSVAVSKGYLFDIRAFLALRQFLGPQIAGKARNFPQNGHFPKNPGFFKKAI